jgi:DNA-directed RNA polymerase specialized sigma24 family protein
MAVTAAEEFETFIRGVRPRLLRAFAGCRGRHGAPDATAEALAYAWEHWERVREMDNPAGYLYRVGLSRTRLRRRPVLPPPDRLGLPDVEPGLIPALLELPETQRTAVTGCLPGERSQTSPFGQAQCPSRVSHQVGRTGQSRMPAM